VDTQTTAVLDRRRWAVLAMLFLAACIGYIDRQTLSVLAPLLRTEFGMSNTDYSNVVNAFLFSFTIMYAVGGRLMDRIGVYRGLLLVVAFRSVAAAAHAFAASAFSLGCFRFLLAMGEAPQPPAYAKTVAEWFPARERGFATSVFLLGATVGVTVAPPLVVFLHRHGGWRYAFVVTGLLGFLWMPLWWLFARGRSAQTTPAAAMVPFRPLLRRRATWGVLSLRFFLDPVWFFYVFWLPEYLVRSKGLDLYAAGMMAWLPFVAADVGTAAGGSIASWLQRRGWSLDRSHKTVMTVSAILMMASALVPALPAAWQYMAAMSVAIVGMQMFGANNHAIPTHMFPGAAVGTVAGMGGACAGIGSMIFTRFIGVSVDLTHSYVPVFVAAGVVYPIMCLVSLKLVGKVEKCEF
jgi:MFS transporter, ACS family, hexuronate transporter